MLCYSQGEVRIDIHFHVFPECSCSPGRLQQLAFNEAQLDMAQSLAVKSVKVKPKASSFNGLHAELPVKAVHIDTQYFADEQILRIMLVRSAQHVDGLAGVLVIA